MLQLKLHHISYLVADTDNSIQSMGTIYPNVDIYKMEEPSQSVYFSYLSSTFLDHKIEIVEPMKENSSMWKYLGNSESTIYHVSYAVESFEEAKKYFLGNGYFMITQPFQPMFSQNSKVCHYFKKNFGIVEIIEENN